MKRISFITTFLLILGMGLAWEFGPWQNSPEMATDIPVLVVPPQLPESAAPSRKQEGGPLQRRSYELSRLADPATGQLPPDIHRQEQEFAAKLPRWQRGGGLDALDPAGKIAGWTYRGPWNIGGRTRALALDISDPDLHTLLAGGISGGMWRSADDGMNWVLTTGSSQLHSVTSLAQDVRPGQEDVWYYGTGEVRGNSAGASGAPYRGDGVFKSVDGGVSWALLPVTSAADPTVYSSAWQYIWRVAVDSSELTNDEIYVAALGLIFRSLDGGQTFTAVLGDENYSSSYTDVVVDSNGVVYATLNSSGGSPGIYRSVDGVSWTNITPAGLTSYGRIVLGLAPSNENIMYALVADRNGTSSEGFYKYTYLSGDGSGAGGSWVDRSAQMANQPGPGGGVGSLETYGGYTQMVTVNPTDPDLVYIGGMHLIRSTDGFATSGSLTWIGGWQYDNHHADSHILIFKPGSDTIVYTGSDGGVHKCIHIENQTPVWSSLNRGYNTSQFYTVAIDENLPDNDVIIGGMQDNGTWFTSQVSNTASWVEAFGGDGSFCAVADASGSEGTYYVSYQGGYIYRMVLDNQTGQYLTWTRVDPSGGGDYQFINPFILDPTDTRMMYVSSSHGIWRNNDLTVLPDWNNNATSTNWEHLTTEPNSIFVTALAMSRSVGRILYYGSSTGGIYRLDNAHTAAVGTTPTSLHGGLGLPGGSVSGLGIHPDDDQQVLLSFSNYNIASLFFTDDGGATWSNVEGNLAGASGPSVRSTAILTFGESGVLYLAATSTGLYSTRELAGAETMWFLEGADVMGNVVVDMIKSRSEDGLLVAGTHGKGVYSVIVPPSSAVGDAVKPLAAVLAQNVPNPFNPRTVIAFDLPSASHVRLEIFDIGGRLVKTLLNESLGAGSHTAHWEGTDDRGRAVSTGMYLYRLRSGDTDEVRRMTLIR